MSTSTPSGGRPPTSGRSRRASPLLPPARARSRSGSRPGARRCRVRHGHGTAGRRRERERVARRRGVGLDRVGARDVRRRAHDEASSTSSTRPPKSATMRRVISTYGRLTSRPRSRRGSASAPAAASINAEKYWLERPPGMLRRPAGSRPPCTVSGGQPLGQSTRPRAARALRPDPGIGAPSPRRREARPRRRRAPPPRRGSAPWCRCCRRRAAPSGARSASARRARLASSVRRRAPDAERLERRAHVPRVVAVEHAPRAGLTLGECREDERPIGDALRARHTPRPRRRGRAGEG